MNTNKCFIKGDWPESLPLDSGVASVVVGDILVKNSSGALVVGTTGHDMETGNVVDYYISNDYIESVGSANAGETASVSVGKLTVFPLTTSMRIEGMLDHFGSISAKAPLSVIGGVVKTAGSGDYVFGFALNTATASTDPLNLTTEGAGYKIP